MSSAADKAFDYFSEQIVAREPSEIKRASKVALDQAIKEGFYHKPAQTGARILAFGDIKATGKLSDFEGFKTAPFKDLLTGFLVAKGNLSQERAWLYHEDLGIYVCFPSLMAPGRGGIAQWALAEDMARVIQGGKDSNLISYLKRGKMRPSEDNRKYFFAKGYTLLDNKEEAVKAKGDIEKIILLMNGDKGVKNPTPRFNLDFLEIRRAL
jgi:hypothetical protein